ncbi:MAG: bifunctional diaminohydroxyphosphoribosylaminopyrimidine deaminase/5-amino-6-(5-phosphoribosylamino)uracil reductase RibD [Ilumatobacteraceae bacterium]
MTTIDEQAMQLAVATAAQARLRSRPNPWVGAVITNSSGVIATGATEAVGGAHAEIVALRAAGERARGATLYTTLEPCHHIGRTGPCTKAIIDAGISRVVVGVVDPDEQVSGRGITAMRQAGISVEVGVCSQEVTAQLEPYLHHRRTKRPFVVLKMASTIDGRTSAADGTSQWITGEDARRRVHELRAESDAILVGAGTVRVDDPYLNVRDVAGESPRRIVLGNIDAGAHVHPCLEYNGDLSSLLDTLGGEGVVQLLVEGGPRVAASFHSQGLVNRYIMHIAPVIAGGDDANPVFRGSGAGTMAEMWRGRIVATTRLGDDIEIILQPLQSASLAST